MDIETKFWIIIIIVFLITLRTFIDLFYSTNFHLYNKIDDAKDDDKIYDKYMFIKSFLDIPIIILSLILLINIKFNVKIYLFLFLSIFTIFTDHYFQYLDISLSSDVTYFMERYFTLFLDIIIFMIGTYTLYKIFYISN
jgi:hypothetical protein